MNNNRCELQIEWRGLVGNSVKGRKAIQKVLINLFIAERDVIIYFRHLKLAYKVLSSKQLSDKTQCF